MSLPSFPFSFGAPPPAATGATGAAELIGEAFDAGGLTPDAGGELELPGWMRVVCATVGRTAQASAATVATGYAAHARRAVSRDGATWGLLLEAAATNLVANTLDLDDAEWTKTGTPPINSIAGPDGTTGNYEVEDDDAGSVELLTSTNATVYGLANEHTLSAWMKRTGTAGTNATVDPNDGGLSLTISTEDATWIHRDMSDFPGASPANFLMIPRPGAIANLGALGVWGTQVELGSYPSSFMGVACSWTRAADECRADPDAIALGGRFHIELRWRPHYDDTEQVADHNLIWFDADNRLFLRVSDSKLVLEIAGVELASTAVTFSRYQELTITVEHSETQRRLLVSGATTGDSDTTGAAADAITLGTAAYILGSSTGSEESAELVGVSFPDLVTFATLAASRALIRMSDTPGAGNRNLRDLLEVLAVGAGRYRDVCYAVRNTFDLDHAIGDQLDIIGSQVGLTREGFTDARYRVFLGIQVELLLAAAREDSEWPGTCESILRICRTFAGAAAGTITLTNYPPLHYIVQVPDLVLAEAYLLARFLRTANYAATVGQMIVIISVDSLWESDVAPVASGATWDSDVLPIAGAGQWQIVVST